MRSNSVADRVGRLTVPLVPLAGAPVQGRHPIRLLLEQPRLEDVREELVVAIPPTLVVERNDEQIAALEGLQHRIAAIATGNRIA
jgi:hypothetical protein